MSLWDEQNLNQHEAALTNLYIDNLEQGMRLISSLLAEDYTQTPLSQALHRFYELADQELMSMINWCAPLHGAAVYEGVLLFRKRLEELVSFPEIFTKKIVAVGGGFSAGKSRLINMIVGEEVLPTDTTPTTSIPSYVMKGDSLVCVAHNVYGRKQQLDEEALQAITHAFTDKYSVSFGQILRNLLIKSVRMKYDNITILDTPGYSKSDHHKKESNKDEHTARIHLQAADCLIWVVDIEKGTIPQQDFEFIQSMKLNCPIFFLFNKADKKEKQDIQTILTVAKENASNQGIVYAGVGAISSLLQEEYGEDRLDEFLSKENQRKREVSLQDEFRILFQPIEKDIDDRIHELQVELRQLNELALASSNKHEQQLLRRIITKKKKSITEHKEKKQQLPMKLSPFLLLLENIQEQLMSYKSSNYEPMAVSQRSQFLRQLLKIPVKGMIENKVERFIKELQKNEKELTTSNLLNTFQQSIWLLQRDIILKIEKDMLQQYINIKRSLSPVLTEREYEEFCSMIHTLLQSIVGSLQQESVTIRQSEQLVHILNQHDAFSLKVLQQLLQYEALRLGDKLKESICSAYKEIIMSMLKQQ